jgi:hypothetical protein
LSAKNSMFAVLLGLVFSSPIAIIATGIIFAAVFIASLSFLIFYGLVSALIYGFGAFLLVAFVGLLMGKENLQNHWHSFFAFVALVPIAMLFGWFTDRMGSFGLSLIPVASQQFIVSQDAWNAGSFVMVSGAYIIALVALGLAMFVAALLYVKGKTKRRRK